MAKYAYDEWGLKRQSQRSFPHVRNYIERASLQLHGGSVRDVLTIEGWVEVTGMWMVITTAVTNSACNMSWVYDVLDGGDQTIGDTVAIANSAVGDRYYAEFDGTNVVKLATTALFFNVGLVAADDRGLLLGPGGIDIILSAHAGLLAGAGQMFIEYTPITHNAKIWAGRIHSTTSTTSSTSSSTSSSSSTASTSSTSSSTSTTSSTTTTGP